MALSKVRYLTVKEISVMWSDEVGIDSSIICREMRIALYKLQINYPFEKDIDIFPDNEHLPSAETIINREFIEKFCDKEMWKLPKFWFSGLSTEQSFPGRPSIMSAIVQELQRRGESGLIAETLAAEARLLSDWASHQFSGIQTPKPRSIQNGIRTYYNIIQRSRRGEL